MFALPSCVTVFLAVCYSSGSFASPVGEPSTPLITPAPLLLKREAADYPDFIGYYSDPGKSTYTASTCAGISYDERRSDSDWYGGCQTTSVLSIFTSCSGNVAYGVSIFNSGTTSTTALTSKSCYSTCITDILETDPSATTFSYFIQCEFRTGMTLFREPSNALPALAGSTSRTTTITTSSSSTTSPPTTTSPFPPPTTSPPPPSPTPPPKRLGTGAIVGIVIGSLAAILFIVTLIFFILKKRQHRNSQHAAQSQPVLMNPNAPPTSYPPGMAPIQAPEKAAKVQTQPVPMGPYSPHQSWNPSSPMSPVGQENMGMSPPGSPPGSPPPGYFHQPQPQYPQQGYQPGPGQNFQQQGQIPGGPPPVGGYPQ